MAKKGKHSTRAAQEPQGPNLDVGESRKRIRDYEDVADSDDEFHVNRDKVLLGEEPDAKRRRKWQEQEEFLQPSDEEVLSYSEAEEEDEDEDEDHEDGLVPSQVAGEVASESEASGEEEDEDGIGWGTTKADLYGTDAIETEEQALEEEAEGLRLQKRQLQAMTAADYGFDESDWQDSSKPVGEDLRDAHVTEILPQQQLQIPDELSAVERLKLLKSQYPEFEPLSRELLQMRETHASLLELAQRAESGNSSQSAPNAIIKLRAASAYLGTLTMYFAILTSPASDGSAKTIAMSAIKLRDHPVMDHLVACRDTWQRAKELPVDDQSPELDVEDAFIDANVEDDHSIPSLSISREKLPRQQKSRAQKHADAAQVAADARRAERMKRTEADLADLDALVATSRSSNVKRRKDRAVGDAESDVGEEAPLTTREAAEKAQRKKSLRFYTSQIAQKASKRGSAGRNAGGDDDVPHRERLRDRQARLNAEAEKRGKRDVDHDTELGGEMDDDDIRQAEAVRQEADDGDYYDLVAARTAKKKSDKVAFAEAQKLAAAQGGQVVQQDVVGPDGKRKISYLIEKNKGLTPHRKKDVRNPRVKKRKKYDEKKKKLASMKPVYKGGEGRGGYGGELTGIKKGLVKSTKL